MIWILLILAFTGLLCCHRQFKEMSDHLEWLEEQNGLMKERLDKLENRPVKLIKLGRFAE